MFLSVERGENRYSIAHVPESMWRAWRKSKTPNLSCRDLYVAYNPCLPKAHQGRTGHCSHFGTAKMKMVTSNGARFAHHNMHVAVVRDFVGRKRLEYSSARIAMRCQNLDPNELRERGICKRHG